LIAEVDRFHTPGLEVASTFRDAKESARCVYGRLIHDDMKRLIFDLSNASGKPMARKFRSLTYDSAASSSMKITISGSATEGRCSRVTPRSRSRRITHHHARVLEETGVVLWALVGQSGEQRFAGGQLYRFGVDPPQLDDPLSDRGASWSMIVYPPSLLPEPV
jgi:hypothetical protein